MNISFGSGGGVESVTFRKHVIGHTHTNTYYVRMHIAHIHASSSILYFYDKISRIMYLCDKVFFFVNNLKPCADKLVLP